MKKQTNVSSSDISKNLKTNQTIYSAINASRPAFIVIAFFSFFINLLMLTGPIFMLQIYDRVLSSRSLPTLAVLFALVAGLFIVMGLLEFIRSRILARIGVHVGQRIHEKLFDAVMQLSLRTNGNEKSTAPLRELEIVQQYLAGPGFVVLFDAPWVPIYIGVIFLFHPMLGWLGVVAALVLFIIAILNDIRARKPSNEVAQTSAQTQHIAEIGRRNTEAFAAMGMFGSLRSRWSKKYNKNLMAQTIARDRGSSLSAVSKSFRLFVQSAMLALGAVFVIYGEITAGVMIAASIILGRALQPIEQAITHWRGFVRYKEAKKKLGALLKNIPADKDKTSLKKPTGSLEVNALFVAAPEEKKYILSNINIKLPAGRTLGIIGDSASGKTTLARILVGVWKPTAGNIRLDGATYDQWHQDELGQYLGYVSQNVELFDGTIAQNISRLEDNPKSSDIIKAAEQAFVHDLVKQLGGYDFNIGVGASNLSAGQRQRIALARALYKQPSLIVLDEPNSNLDEHGDYALQMAVKGIRERGQTLIIIAHKKNILAQADDLLVLHEGKQVAYDTRDNVLNEIRKKATKVRRQARREQRNAAGGFQIITGGNPAWSGQGDTSQADNKDDNSNE